MTLLVAGCTGDDGSGEDDGAAQTPEACETDTGAQGGQSYGTVACEEASGTGTTTATFDCPTPSQSQVRVGSNMTAGSATVTVEDASQEVVYETTLEGREQNQTVIGEGEAGEWRITGETTDDYEGTYAGQVLCPTEEGANQEPQTGCNSQAGQRQGHDVARIVCRGVEGSDTTQQAFPCSTPGEAKIGVQTQLSSGSVTVRLTQADGSTIYEETFSGENREQVNLTGQAAGEWQLSGTRDQAYAGDYVAQATCPTAE